jgi:hypothetical protein
MRRSSVWQILATRLTAEPGNLVSDDTGGESQNVGTYSRASAKCPMARVTTIKVRRAGGWNSIVKRVNARGSETFKQYGCEPWGQGGYEQSARGIQMQEATNYGSGSNLFVAAKVSSATTSNTDH